MNKTLRIEKRIDFFVEKSKVWDALVNPNIIKKYLFGTEVISDWNVGSPMIFKGEWEGKTFEDKGNILMIANESIFKYNYWSGFSGLPDLPENYSIVTYQLEASKNHTTLKLTQEGFANEQARSHSEVSWDIVLQSMQDILG